MEFLKNLGIEFRHAITICVILVLAFTLTRIAKWLINKTFVIASDKIRVDPTRYKFFKHVVAFIIWMIAIATIFYSIPELRSLAITLFAGAGILVAIAGFAAQEAFSNIISGVFIVIFKPFRVGDIIKVGDRDYGVVEDITLRHTVLVNFENKRIIIPNSVMSNETIVNDSIGESKICRFIEVGISYDSDVNRALKILQEVSEAHPLCIDNRSAIDLAENKPLVNTRVISFEDSSVLLRAYVWTIDPVESYQMHADINKSLKLRFDKEGIEIPFPHRTIVYKTDLEKKANEQAN